MFEGLNVPIVTAVAGCGTVSALIDMRTRRVPNPLTLGIAVTGLALAATRWSGLSVATAALAALRLLLTRDHDSRTPARSAPADRRLQRVDVDAAARDQPRDQ